MSTQTHRLKSIKNFSKWLVLPNDLTGQLRHNEDFADRKNPELAKAIEDKLEEWRSLLPEKGNRSPELNPLKAELWDLLSAYETETGSTFYQ
jgi:hypothetical protein